MKTKLFLLILAIVGCCYTSSGKKPDKIKVKVEAAGIARENTIAALDISSYAVPEGSTVIVRHQPDNTIVNSQLESGNGKTTLYWMIEGKLKENESRNYSIECVPAKREEVIMDVQQDRSGNLILSRNNKNILQYNTAMARLPHGADPVFSRNGYIHPVWAPDGNVLTSVNPPDHMHHYGIWNPWTSVEYDGLKYDLWNLGDKTGTVRFDTLYQTNTGRLFANIRTGHKHIIFQPQQEQVINTRESLIRIMPKKRSKHYGRRIEHLCLELRKWKLSLGFRFRPYTGNKPTGKDDCLPLRRIRFTGYRRMDPRKLYNNNLRRQKPAGDRRNACTVDNGYMQKRGRLARYTDHGFAGKPKLP